MSGTKLIGIVGAVLVILVVLRLVVRRRLLVKYASLWLVVSVLLVVLAVIPGSLKSLADLLGFVVPANLLFFAGFLVLLFVTLQISVELTTVERRLQRLAEELAIARESEERPDAR
jgi:hypothetical protein